MEAPTGLTILGVLNVPIRHSVVIAGPHEAWELISLAVPRRRLNLVDVLAEFAENAQVAPLLRKDLMATADIGVVEFVNRIARTESDLFRLCLKRIIFRSPAETSVTAQFHL